MITKEKLVSLRLSEALLQTLDDTAKVNGIGRSEVIRRLLQEKLEIDDKLKLK